MFIWANNPVPMHSISDKESSLSFICFGLSLQDVLGFIVYIIAPANLVKLFAFPLYQCTFITLLFDLTMF